MVFYSLIGVFFFLLETLVEINIRLVRHHLFSISLLSSACGASDWLSREIIYFLHYELRKKELIRMVERWVLTLGNKKSFSVGISLFPIRRTIGGATKSISAETKEGQSGPGRT